MLPKEDRNFVWTMGKVGSSTLMKSVRKTGRRCFHLHTLRSERLNQLEAHTEERGIGIRDDFLQSTREAIASIPDWFDGGAKIITAVREPVARNLSAFFHNLEAFTDDTERDLLAAKFVETYPHGVPLRWFDDEIKGILSVDLLALPFNVTRGWSIYKVDGVEILVLRIDCDDDTKKAALSELYQEEIPIHSQNLGDAKEYATLYKLVHSGLKLPESLLKRMYDAPYTRHFWSEAEINAFRQKWAER